MLIYVIITLSWSIYFMTLLINMKYFPILLPAANICITERIDDYG